MRRFAPFLTLLLALGQIALGLHQIEHRFDPAAPDQAPCGICAIADHLGDAPAPAVPQPKSGWTIAVPAPFLAQHPRSSGPAQIRARAPPLSLA